MGIESTPRDTTIWQMCPIPAYSGWLRVITQTMYTIIWFILPKPCIQLFDESCLTSSFLYMGTRARRGAHRASATGSNASNCKYFP